ncbi:hypothetical protein F4703DRAFT_1599442 [Phycomyces blakesleeanus]
MTSLERSTSKSIKDRSKDDHKLVPKRTRSTVKPAVQSFTSSGKHASLVISDDEFQPIFIPKRLLARKKIKPNQESTSTQNPTQSLSALPKSSLSPQSRSRPPQEEQEGPSLSSLDDRDSHYPNLDTLHKNEIQTDKYDNSSLLLPPLKNPISNENDYSLTSVRKQQHGFLIKDPYCEEPQPFTQILKHRQSPTILFNDGHYSDTASIGSEEYYKSMIDEICLSPLITTPPLLPKQKTYSQTFNDFSDDELFSPLRHNNNDSDTDTDTGNSNSNNKGSKNNRMSQKLNYNKYDNNDSSDVETIDLTIKQEVLSTQGTSLEIEDVSEWLNMGSVKPDSPRFDFMDNKSGSYSDIRSWTEEQEGQKDGQSLRKAGDTSSFEVQDNDYYFEEEYNNSYDIEGEEQEQEQEHEYEYEEEYFRPAGSVSETQCPMCYAFFPGEVIQEHAAECIGSSDLVRSPRTNKEQCPICGGLVDKDLLQGHVEGELAAQQMSVQTHSNISSNRRSFVNNEIVEFQDPLSLTDHYDDRGSLSPLLGFTSLLKYRLTKPDCAKYFDQFESAKSRKGKNAVMSTLFDPSQGYNETSQSVANINNNNFGAGYGRDSNPSVGRMNPMDPMARFVQPAMTANRNRQGSLSPLLGFTSLLDHRLTHPECAKYFNQFDARPSRTRTSTSTSNSSSTNPARGKPAPRGRPKRQARQRRGSKRRE